MTALILRSTFFMISAILVAGSATTEGLPDSSVEAVLASIKLADENLVVFREISAKPLVQLVDDLR